MQFTPGYLKRKISPRLNYMEGWMYGRTRTDDFPKTKMSWMHRQPNFLTHGAPL